MANNADSLYATIFDTIEKLKNKDTPMEIDRAKAIAGIVQTAINLAKVEVDHMKVRGGNGVTFFDLTKEPIPLPPDDQHKTISSPKVIEHRLR